MNSLFLKEIQLFISLGTQIYMWCAFGGSLSKTSQPIFTRVLEKTTENSKRLGWQARPRNEPGTSRIPVFQRSHWWGHGRTARHPCLARDSNPGRLVQQPASLTTSPQVGYLSLRCKELAKAYHPPPFPVAIMKTVPPLGPLY